VERAIENSIKVKPPKGRIAELESILDGWLPQGGMTSYELWQLCKASQYSVLPSAGGWLNQPQWWLDDLLMMMLLEELKELQHKQAIDEARAQASKPIVTMNDLNGLSEL
jgi:hypothetical protein